MRALVTVVALFCMSAALGQTPLSLGSAYQIHSVEVGESRTLNVYLPPGYNNADTQKYPVIYLLDGGMDEDFIHVVGLVQFNSFPWVRRVPESIVVGIVNTDRKRDMTYPSKETEDKKLLPTSGGSAKFIAFIEKEVQPFVQSKFRTNDDKTIIGESLGGLLASEILLTRPALFNKYIIVSPSLWWDDGALLKKEVLQAIGTGTKVYIGVGKEGVTPGGHPHVMEVDANLLADKLNGVKGKNVAVYLDYLPDETHATIGHHAVFDAFKWLSLH